MGASSEASVATWWWRAFGYRVGERTLSRMLERHREAHRHYHTVSHVEWVLRHVDTLALDVQLADPGAVIAAAFFHDAVYEPTAGPGDNEHASALLATGELAAIGWSGRRAERVAELIESTAGHQAAPADRDMCVLVDSDLAVLGSDAAAYDAYVHGVRSEYRHLDNTAWRAGRTTVLRHFLDRPAIFATEAGQRHWEERARANIAAELAAMHDGG